MRNNGTWNPKEKRVTYANPPRSGEMLATHTISDTRGASEYNQNLAAKKGMDGAKKSLFGRYTKKK